jgi:hypothetical protein
MQTRRTVCRAIVLLGFCVALCQAADQNPPAFYFDGKRVFVGMPQAEAVASLSSCCKLLPPAESWVEKRPVAAGTMPGHFIVTKESSERILGGIFFSSGKVARVTRPPAEEVDTWNDDVVGFARAIKRSLLADTGSGTTVVVSGRHERMSNAESDVVSFSFPNGRGIELHIGTLDKPDTNTNKTLSRRPLNQRDSRRKPASWPTIEQTGVETTT